MDAMQVKCGCALTHLDLEGLFSGRSKEPWKGAWKWWAVAWLWDGASFTQLKVSNSHTLRFMGIYICKEGGRLLILAAQRARSEY